MHYKLFFNLFLFILIFLNLFFSYLCFFFFFLFRIEKIIRPVSGPSRPTFLPPNNANSKYSSGSYGAGVSVGVGGGEKQVMSKSQLRVASQGNGDVMLTNYLRICYIIYYLFIYYLFIWCVCYLHSFNLFILLFVYIQFFFLFFHFSIRIFGHQLHFYLSRFLSFSTSFINLNNCLFSHIYQKSFFIVIVIYLTNQWFYFILFSFSSFTFLSFFLFPSILVI